MTQSNDPVALPPEGADAASEEAPQEIEAKIMVASQWKLIWWKFRRHKLAMAAGAVVIAIYAIAAFAEFFQVAPPDQYAARYTYAPPQTIHIIDTSSGTVQLAPYVNGYKVTIDSFSLRRTFVVDPEQKIPFRCFARGFEYKLLGLIPWDRHLIGPVNKDDPLYILGADDDRRRPGLDVYRSARRFHQPGVGHPPGRHLGLLRRGR